jgi:drug/metabolite transporter (DMT)-like permease
MPMSDEPRSTFSRLGLVLLGALALGWGINWPIMKITLWDVPPLTFRGVALAAGGAGVLLLARLGGHRLTVERRHWGQVFRLSVFNVIGWNLLVIYGVALVPAGRSALIAYTMPVWSMLLSVWLLNERLTARRIAALALGMGGVVTLLGAEVAALGGSPLGVALLLGAAFSWALGIVLLKRYAVPIPTVSLTGWLMFIGSLPFLVAAVALEHGQWRPIGPWPAFGVLYNIFVGFMFCYWAWNRIVLMVPVAVASLSSLITPLIGVAAGVVLLEEALTWREGLAGLLILGAIALVIRAPAAKPAPRARAGAATFER